MTVAPDPTWSEQNQRYLTLALDLLREHLERGSRAGALRFELERYGATMAVPPALERVRGLFDLTPFERDVLLLAAAADLDSSFPALFAQSNGVPAPGYPTFSLALGLLPHAHWSALVPSAPLRRWSLIELDPHGPLTASALRASERILHALAGIDELDAALVPYVELARGTPALPPTYRAAVDALSSLFAQSLMEPGVLFQCTGPVDAARRIVLGALDRLEIAMLAVPSEAIPAGLPERVAFALALQRESLLEHAVACVVIGADDGPETIRTALDLLERLRTPRILIAPRRQATALRSVALPVERLPVAEQCAEWRATLGAAGDAVAGELGTIVTGFDLELAEIASAATQARTALAAHPGADPSETARTIRAAARLGARAHLDPVATRIERKLGWDDLVVPEHVGAQLREIVLHVREQRTVFDAWNFRADRERGLGVSALFCGPSGTGKTSAAEALAAVLDLDLYRIDLSSVVSKYIGETEKNLRRVFDAAERGTAILLFDEADALFGKRSEVRDSHDRHANVEVAYLLSRIETYRGIAILTTNLKDALDGAFVRRLRFIVDFAFPDAAERRLLWQRVFPVQAPLGDLDYERLGALSLTGASIRDVALAAAFAAAGSGEAITMAHVQAGLRREYRKLGRNPAEIGA